MCSEVVGVYFYILSGHNDSFGHFLFCPESKDFIGEYIVKETKLHKQYIRDLGCVT